jgi:osmotically inducible lipoprotein OsmB
MGDTERRTTAGAAIGGIAAGDISGEWGWAAVGAAVGAASGYVYDQHKKHEEQAYSQGAQDARSR